MAGFRRVQPGEVVMIRILFSQSQIKQTSEVPGQPLPVLSSTLSATLVLRTIDLLLQTLDPNLIFPTVLSF